MTNDFSGVKEYLIGNELLNQDNKILISSKQPKNTTWGLGPYIESEAIIHLFILIKFFNEYCHLDNLSISIEKDKTNDLYFKINIDEIDRNYDYAHPNLEWNLILDTSEFLVKHMPPSDVSYLAAQLLK